MEYVSVLVFGLIFLGTIFALVGDIIISSDK